MSPSYYNNSRKVKNKGQTKKITEYKYLKIVGNDAGAEKSPSLENMLDQYLHSEDQE